MAEPDTHPRVVYFVDGFNLYHSVREAEKQLPQHTIKWLNLPALCADYLHQVGGGAQLKAVHYFTAYADHLREKYPEKIIRHKAFVRALTARKVVTHISKFSPKRVWSEEIDRWVRAHEEKETDVAIACEVLGMAMDDELDVAILMTGDSDFAPVAEAFQQRFPHKKIMFALPFARGTNRLKQL